MEVLDTSIANVALPHMAGSLGASQDEATWVLTSYLVASAVILPISGWLSDRFGRKRFYITCVIMFTACSLLCGLAPTLPFLVFARVLQGLGGGGLAPSEQAILADTFPVEKRGQAFAVYGMAVVVAPAIGPTLGGWITDNFNWHWIFFINIPIGLFSVWLSSRMVEDPPALVARRKASVGRKVDFTGLALVASGVGVLEFFLDKGQEKDWFGSDIITTAAIVAAVLLVTFVFWEWNHEDPIVDLKLLKNRNFGTAVFLQLVLGMVLFGSTVLIPQYLQTLLGFTPPQLAGEALSPAGFVMMFMMFVAGRLIGKMDPRLLVCIGLRPHCRWSLQSHAPLARYQLCHHHPVAHVPGHRSAAGLHPHQHPQLRRCADHQDEPNLQPLQLRPQSRWQRGYCPAHHLPRPPPRKRTSASYPPTVEPAKQAMTTTSPTSPISPSRKA